MRLWKALVIQVYCSVMYLSQTILNVFGVSNRSLQAEDQARVYPAELGTSAALKFFPLASVNLGSPVKAIRLATLRVLSYFEPLSNSHEDGSQNDSKRQKRNDGLSKENGKGQTSKVNKLLL